MYGIYMFGSFGKLFFLDVEGRINVECVFKD